jgi:nucleotide-binding universal stress UspA family protein
MKRILVPCDFSEPAIEAYKFALDLATASEGEVLVLKAIDLPIMLAGGFDVQPYTFDPSILKDLEDDAKKKYAEMKKKQGQLRAQETFHVKVGAVTPMIRNFIDNQKIDLVIMGTHGSTGLNEYLYGSNTERVVRFSPVPVLAIRKAPAISSVKKIAFPSTLSLDQTELVSKVKSLQDFFGASLHLLWVNTPAFFRRNQEVNVLLKEFVIHFKLKDYTLNIRNDISEQEGIVAFANEINADIVAMATHGRRGLAHLLTSSIAEDVVNHVQCPIWTYSIHKKK